LEEFGEERELIGELKERRQK